MIDLGEISILLRPDADGEAGGDDRRQNRAERLEHGWRDSNAGRFSALTGARVGTRVLVGEGSMRNNIWVRMIVLGSLVVLVPAMAQAQATRTWVSGVGDDVNPCSRSAPCKTFAGALSKTIQSGGEINTLDSGGFGAVTLSHPITIRAIGV